MHVLMVESTGLENAIHPAGEEHVSAALSRELLAQSQGTG